MAIKPDKFKNEIFMPGGSDSRWETMDNDYADNMLRNMDKTLFEDLGIDTSLRDAEKDIRGNLILYQMDEDGKISNPFDEDVQPNSFPFLEKISQGKIFAYPAGGKDPVQLQINYDNDPPEITYSKPMTENVFPKPEPPGFWTRVRAFFGGSGAKAEIAEYNDSLKRYENSSSVKEAAKNSRTDDMLEQEKKAYEDSSAERTAEAEEAARREKQERLYADSENYKSKVDRSMDLMQDIYGPKPVKIDNQIGCQYTNEQFSHLKTYNTDNIKIEGKAITDRQFMGVALAAAYTPECGGSVRAFKELTPEENMATNSTFYTSDLYAWGKSGRAGIGQYFEKVQGPARENAYQALQEYQNGNKEPLGKLLGNALHFSATKLEHYNVSSDAFVSANAALAQTVSILDQDPELKKIAMESGMTEADLNVARADLEIAKQYKENEWAEGRLEEDTRAMEGDDNSRKLTEEEKKFCIDARLRYQTLDQASKLHVTERESSEDYVTGLAKVIAEREIIDKEHSDYNKAHQKGKLTDEEYQKSLDIIKNKETANTIKIKNVHTSVVGIPKEFRELGAASAAGKPEAALDKIVNSNLPNKNMLYSMDSKELAGQLELKTLFGKASPYMPAPEIKEVPKVDAPVKQAQQQEKTAQNEQAPAGPVM